MTEELTRKICSEAEDLVDDLLRQAHVHERDAIQAPGLTAQAKRLWAHECRRMADTVAILREEAVTFDSGVEDELFLMRRVLIRAKKTLDSSKGAEGMAKRAAELIKLVSKPIPKKPE